jgi:hypothetical protein
MKFDWREIWNKLNNPSVGLLALTYPLTLVFCALAIVGAVVDTTAVWTYPIYAAAAITLFYSVYTLVRFAPKIKKSVLSLVHKWDYTKRYAEDFEFRTIVNAIGVFAFNAGYAIFLAVMGVLFRSVWYGGLAFYYIVLAFVSGAILVRSHRDNKKYKDDFKTLLKRRVQAYAFSGWMLIVMAQVIAGCLVQLVWTGWSFHYADLMIFAFAAFAFLKITMAIINMIKATKRNGIVTRAVRHINLSSALVSILALQTALFDSFGGGGDFRLANALTGMAVFVFTVLLGVYTIIDGRRRLKRYEDTNGEEDERGK